MTTIKNILSATIILLVGIVIGFKLSEPTPMQKMLGIHDHMRSAEIRYWWRQTYCGDVKGNPELVVKE